MTPAEVESVWIKIEPWFQAVHMPAVMQQLQPLAGTLELMGNRVFIVSQLPQNLTSQTTRKRGSFSLALNNRNAIIVDYSQCINLGKLCGISNITAVALVIMAHEAGHSHNDKSERFSGEVAAWKAAERLLQTTGHYNPMVFWPVCIACLSTYAEEQIKCSA